MDIYIKPAKKCSIAGRKKIYVKDIAEVSAPDEIKARVKDVKLFEVSDKPKKNYLVSIIDIINAIDKVLPGHTINNVGEMDVLINYRPTASKDNPVWKWLKIAFVTILLTAGSATAIMSFQSDSQIPTVYKNYYKIFFNEEIENPAIINIPYSIGLAFGIIVFFNHFMGKKITDDPTPIEVEMTMYEANVTDTTIDVLDSQRKNHLGHQDRQEAEK